MISVVFAFVVVFGFSVGFYIRLKLLESKAQKFDRWKHEYGQGVVHIHGKSYFVNFKSRSLICWKAWKKHLSVAEYWRLRFALQFSDYMFIAFEANEHTKEQVYYIPQRALLCPSIFSTPLTSVPQKL